MATGASADRPCVRSQSLRSFNSSGLSLPSPAAWKSDWDMRSSSDENSAAEARKGSEASNRAGAIRDKRHMSILEAVGQGSETRSKRILASAVEKSAVLHSKRAHASAKLL